MRFRNSATGYGAVSVLLHWLTVVLVAVAWSLGTFGDALPRGGARAAGLFVHISGGLLILALLGLRLAWRWYDPPPPPAATRFGAWLDVAARLTHFALYGLLVATPAIGIVLQFARGDALPIFGIAEIASPWVKDRALAGSLKEVHEVLANVLMIVAGLHAAAALIHHWVLRDRTLARMLPGITR
jgi:cytochrome b561